MGPNTEDTQKLEDARGGGETPLYGMEEQAKKQKKRRWLSQQRIEQEGSRVVRPLGHEQLGEREPP